MFTYNNVLDMIEHDFIFDEIFFISNDGFIFVNDIFDRENTLCICGIKGDNIYNYDEAYMIEIEENSHNRIFNFYKPTKDDIITYDLTPTNLTEEWRLYMIKHEKTQKVFKNCDELNGYYESLKNEDFIDE